MSDEKKKGFCGRLVKFAVLCMAGFLGFAILLVATLPLWISPVATGVAGKVVPGLTGTDFRIERFCLNPYSGTLRIGGVRLSNPEGFGEAAAFSLSGFNVEVSVGSLFSDTILVREIAIEDAFASYYSHDGKNNFDVILANVEKATGPKEAKSGKGAESGKKSSSSGKKVIIEHLRIAGTKVKLIKSDMMPPLMLPTLELTDIGKKSNGATLEEAWTQIADAVMKSMSQIGDGIGALGAFLGDGAKDVSGMFNGGAAGNTAKKTADAVGNAAKGAADALGDTSKKAAEGVKNLFKGFGK